MITIIDYGMGNLRSVSKALEHLGKTVEVTDDPRKVEQAERLILPGVGAFGDAMAELQRRNLLPAIEAFIATERPMLGICLGMQLLMDSSEEAPGVRGLGVVPGEVKRFQVDLKVPSMGWNTVRQITEAPLFRGIADEEYFYFVHSYYVSPAPEGQAAVAGVTSYGIDYASVLWKDNVMATQFHPEKSQQRGLQMLTNFATM